MTSSSEPSEELIVVPKGALAFEAYSPKITNTFVERSVSPETRRAYRRVILEFFQFHNHRHPVQISTEEVQRWRDSLIRDKKSASTVTFKLAVIRSFFEYLMARNILSSNPAATKLVPPPALPESLRGRALSLEEVRHLLSGPNQAKPEGARDYALLLLLLRTSMRVSETCSLKGNSIKWSHGRWVLSFKVKGGTARTIPLPKDVKQAIDEYLKLDFRRRELSNCGGIEAPIFQPHTNYRTLEFNKPLSATMVWHIVKRWGEFTAVGKLSPHDLRRTAITRALNQGMSYRNVQMMTGHKDPKTVMRYDKDRENLEQNAVNFLSYEEDQSQTKEKGG
jgi:integrase/recombinase XerD